MFFALAGRTTTTSRPVGAGVLGRSRVCTVSEVDSGVHYGPRHVMCAYVYVYVYVYMREERVEGRESLIQDKTTETGIARLFVLGC